MDDDNLHTVVNDSSLCEAVNLDVDLTKGEQVHRSAWSCELEDGEGHRSGQG